MMSNPTGDDGGREWIELYNNNDTDLDISSLTVSIKGGTFIPVTQVSGGTTIGAHGYAIIGSVVSGTTKFALDYPTYNGPLFKSSISLVNTGVTSIEIKLQGTTVDALSSYTAVKEGNTYSLINGSFQTGISSPGEKNKGVVVQDDTPATSTQSGNQTTIPQSSPPSADIMLFLPKEKMVVAGAPSLFSVHSMTYNGKAIDNIVYSWAFGDGGQATGSSTIYRYFYPGKYIAQIEGTNGLIAGTGRMAVQVVAPDITLSTIGYGKYGSYIDITNPSNYDLDLSLWKLSIDGVQFPFPKNTLLASGVTRFSGLTMGFASTTITSDTIIKLLFQNMEEVIRISQGGNSNPSIATSSVSLDQKQTVHPNFLTPKVFIRQVTVTKNIAPSSPKVVATSTIITKSIKKDIRLATFIKSLFGK
jgi:hypothetical protein